MRLILIGLLRLKDGAHALGAAKEDPNHRADRMI
jgi:hypothetical protein